MGVLGHLTKEERESLWETFEKKLKTGTPVLIGVLNKKFLSVPIGTPISIAQQGKNRYETFIKEIKRIANIHLRVLKFLLHILGIFLRNILKNVKLQFMRRNC